MKVAKLLHNPSAGADDDQSHHELVELIESNGFECRSVTTEKKELEEIESDVDFLIVSGGDGTVRLVAGELLNRRLLEKKYPVALLPSGTANNVATTLGIPVEPETVIQSWHAWNLKPFDVGLVEGLPELTYFLESFGYGLFPALMEAMKTVDKSGADTPEKELQLAVRVLHDLSRSFEARYCRVEIDGVDFSGNYLLVEVMNTRMIGPNLNLAPTADPGDGELEIILVAERSREEFALAVSQHFQGLDEPFDLQPVLGRTVVLQWEGADGHADDELLEMKPATEVKIALREGLLEFLVP